MNTEDEAWEAMEKKRITRAGWLALRARCAQFIVTYGFLAAILVAVGIFAHGASLALWALFRDGSRLDVCLGIVETIVAVPAGLFTARLAAMLSNLFD